MVQTGYPCPDGVTPLPSTEVGLGILPNDWWASSRRRVIVAVHGHNSNPLAFLPCARGTSSPPPVSPGQPGYLAWYLCAVGGYGILSIDAGGTQTWANTTEQARFDDAYTYAMNTLKSTSSKVAVLPHSMGGTGFWTWSANGHANSMCCGAFPMEPCCDLQWAAAAYTPTYSTAYAASSFNSNTSGNAAGNATWASEIAAAWPGGYSGSDPMQNPSHWSSLPFPVVVSAATDDPVLPHGQIEAFIAAVNNPNIKLRTPQPIGGHVQVWDGDLASGPIPSAEFRRFFDGLAWS